MSFFNVLTVIITVYIVYYAGNILWDTYKAKLVQNGNVSTREVFNVDDEARAYMAEHQNTEQESSSGPDNMVNTNSDEQEDVDDEDDPSDTDDGISIVGQYDAIAFVDLIRSMEPDRAEKELMQRQIYFTTDTLGLTA